MDTVCGGTSDIIDVVPDENTVMVVHVLPPFVVFAAKLLAPTTIAVVSLICEIEYKWLVVPLVTFRHEHNESINTQMYILPLLPTTMQLFPP
jgi:hypothetical protein